MAKFTQAIARDAANILVNGCDKGGQAVTLRTAIMQTYGKAGIAKGKPLADEFVKMVSDEASALIEASKTIAESSRKVVKSNVVKLATVAPVIEGMTGETRSTIGGSIASMLKFGTELRKAEGDIKAAIVACTTGKVKNNAASAAKHVKSMLSMTGKEKFLTAPAKAQLVNWADKFGIKLGEAGDDYRTL
jgi:hypothetical protein